MAFQRAFLQLLLLGVAAHSAAAARSLQQLGKFGGAPMMTAGMMAQPAIATPGLVAKPFMPTNLVGGVLPAAQPMYVGQNTAPIVAGPTFIGGKGKGAQGAMINSAPGILAAPIIGPGPVITGGIQYQYVPQRVITPVYRQPTQVAGEQVAPRKPKPPAQFNLQLAGFTLPNITLGAAARVLPQIHKKPAVELPAFGVELPERKVPPVNVSIPIHHPVDMIPDEVTNALPARVVNALNDAPAPEVPTLGVDASSAAGPGASLSLRPVPPTPATPEAGLALKGKGKGLPELPAAPQLPEAPPLPAKSIKLTLPDFQGQWEEAREKLKKMWPRRPQVSPTQVSPEYVEQVVMQPMPVQSVAPVVSSSITMPPYIAKPKGKGKLGGGMLGGSMYGGGMYGGQAVYGR